MTNHTGTELPWTGGGPWRILDECKAPRHNSLANGRGRIYTRGGRGTVQITKVEHCICPGARAAIRADNAQRAARAALARAIPLTDARGVMENGHFRGGRAGAWVPQGIRMPDFAGAECRTDYGRSIMDSVISGSGGTNTKAVKEAKKICGRCPIRQTVCDPYVTRAEVPAGTWSGVWAGDTQAERRKKRPRPKREAGGK